MRPRASLFVALQLLALAFVPPAGAVNLTGILVGTTNDFGDPNGVDTFNNPSLPNWHMWHTFLHAKWHCLGVYEGLLPDSLYGRPRPINEANIQINIPLEEGENYFTLVGQPGPGTKGDFYERFLVNLYFDGATNIPGVSVLFPRRGNVEGNSTSPNRSQYIYSFFSTLSDTRIPGITDSEGFEIYDDGTFRVTVPSASMLFSGDVPEFEETTIDLVSEHVLLPNNDRNKDADFIGSLTILVEPSSGATTGGAPGFIPAPAGVPAPRSGAGETGVGSAPYVPGYVDSGAPIYDDEPIDDYDVDYGDYDDEPLAELEAPGTPTPKDAVDLLKNWLKDGLGTPTPDGTRTPEGAETPTAEAAETPTPEATGDAAQTETPAATTGTPAAAEGTGSPTPTPSLTPSPTTPRPSPTPARTSAAGAGRPAQ